MPSIQIIFASTSGHTEYVVETLVSFLKEKAPKTSVTMLLAEKVTPEDLLKGDVLLLASSTWNTGNVEGQLNPHMFALLKDRAKAVDLKGRKVVCIGLGDQRYFYTCKAAKELEEFVFTHKGTLALPTLKIINEPYGQEDAVKTWGKSLLKLLK